MTDLIDQLVIPSNAQADRNYYELQESHLQYLKKDPGTYEIEIDALTGDIWVGDFYGLLNHLRIDKKFTYLIMRLNGYSSASDFNGDKTSILIPSPTAIGRIITQYSSFESVG